MKKKVLKITLTVFAVIMAIYAIMLLNTNSLMKDVKSAFLCKTDLSETVGKPINRYNYQGYFDNEEVGKVNLFLCRLFTLHNFRNGYIWAYYTVEAKNTEGKLITGSHRVPTKWKIEKINGKWEIVEIFERA